MRRGSVGTVGEPDERWWARGGSQACALADGGTKPERSMASDETAHGVHAPAGDRTHQAAGTGRRGGGAAVAGDRKTPALGRS